MENGDHIAVLKNNQGIQYFHHGIYVKPNKVIHFAGTDKKSAKVEKVTILHFLIEYLSLVKFIYPDEMCLSPTEVIQTAEMYLMGTKKWDKYCIVTNNCEHFATFCKTGKPKCNQKFSVIISGIINPVGSIKCISS